MLMTKDVFDSMFAKFQPMQFEEELWWLVEKLNVLQPERCLEIGGSTSGAFWGFFAPTVSLTLAHYSSSDVPHQPQDFRGFERMEIDLPGVETYIANSHFQETLDRVSAMGPFDFLFIDGDHSRIGIEQDYKMYAPLVRPGGIIAFHDWDHTGTYPPDPCWMPVQEACKNLGLVIEETKIKPGLGYGIAMLHV